MATEGVDVEAGKAFQIVILGGGGGPIESDCTGLLVRSIGTQWAKNSILAVDAGVHLSAIVGIISQHLSRAVRQEASELSATGESSRTAIRRTLASRTTSRPEYFSPIRGAREARWGSPIPQLQTDSPKLVMTTGPFKDLLLPHESAKANTLYLLRNFISTYLITHPHLDHLSGFAINTAAFQHTTRPKKLAALPSTINAVKSHILNDVVWPNLSDEEGGAGLVSFQRLTEGGNLALGDGEGRGYIEVCDGLAVKAFHISHGRCMRASSSSPHQQRGGSQHINPDFSFSTPVAASSSDRRGSRASLPLSPGFHRKSLSHGELSHQMAAERSSSTAAEYCVVDSSAFFILDELSRRELLVFGDVEPDSISLAPRNNRVWIDAAPKIVAGLLAAVFIECSYDDSQPDETLFGHLNPRHLVAELANLADKVYAIRTGGAVAAPGASGAGFATSTPGSNSNSNSNSNTTPIPTHGAPTAYMGAGFEDPTRKRKREGSIRSPTNLFGSGALSDSARGRTHSPYGRNRQRGSVSPAPPPSHLRSSEPAQEEEIPYPHGGSIAVGVGGGAGNNGGGELGSQTGSQGQAQEQQSLLNWVGSKPLQGLKVVIYHVKDMMKDGPPAEEVILMQVGERAEAVGLGCEFIVARQGEGLYL